MGEAFGVDEVIVVDPDTHTVRIFRGLDEVPDTSVLGITAEWLATQLVWPD